jgi:alpha-tubulin suppressor-like RCC1 family protein
MMAARELGKIRLARFISIVLAAVAAIGGLAAPAGASSRYVTAGALASVRSVTSGSDGTYCALLSTGKVDCWGYGEDGELGHGTTTDSDVAVGVTGLSGVKAVVSSIDGQSFCALLSTGHVKCWGYNGNGELGNGNTTSFTVPVSVKNISTATALTGGDYDFCALLSTGHVDCWGSGGNGELGNGNFNDSDVPVSVRTISNAAKLTGGNSSFCALLTTGHVDCWGYNGDGELGNHSFNDSDVPVAVRTITNVKSVTGGADGTYCALLSTAKVDCWGYGEDGELGHGTTTDSDVPVTVTGLTGAKAVASSRDGQSFCASLSTGHLKCWGYNGNGELGNGNTTSFTVPVSVKNISTAAALTGGNYDFCALLSTSHVDCWGSGGNGELGNGNFNDSDVPVAVRTISNAAKLTGGNSSFCALLSTSHVDCWGYNGDGELGNRSFNDSDVPVAVQAAG